MGEFAPHLGQADLLISRSSSACVEAVAQGTPVIVLGSADGFTQNPIPETADERFWSVCYSTTELRSELRRCIAQNQNLTAEALHRGGQKIRNSYFHPTTESSVRTLLDLD